MEGYWSHLDSILRPKWLASGSIVAVQLPVEMGRVFYRMVLHVMISSTNLALESWDLRVAFAPRSGGGGG